ncbi:RAMP superfamily CRISPR-associated protein [Peptostreptococcus sp. D1]|uniref:RAMP superfamily CRISPR-associated protein n=1 Tax=Peptostreptococcus sp. D1 TaxID=72304 RepID=UPI0008DFE7DD|nr:RAMP superfamily CRISPR-associated protein [Peptostreptococcus sp. D1]SFE78468.1 CRISPR-associated protein Csm3 [Peptostreptococcus sp. D1]
MIEINVYLTTVSSCLIGNQTESFSIGGVDQSTTIDENNKPIIHGSAFKGALRNIIREQEKEGKMNETKIFVKLLLEKTLEKYKNISKNEKIERIISIIEEKYNNCKAEYIFGIEGINGFPRLYCSDFLFSECKNMNMDDYFFIETKNCLVENNGEILSNPRTYRVVRPKVVFKGMIWLNDMFLVGIEENKAKLMKVESEIREALLKFNDGLHRIGNSKSRGYGQIEINLD